MANDTVQQIKDKLTIVEIVTPYVKLTKAGKSLVGLCPFHKEKTPSFHVSVDRGTWHCFGCGLGGDGFSFIEKIEGVDFKGALKILAEKAGVQIIFSRGTHEDKSKLERLREAMNRACEWYAGNFPGSQAEKYAQERGLSGGTTAAWRLGYAPDSWRALLEALSAQGFLIPELLAAGLIKEADGKQGTYYDRFRNRLMFPIRDNVGRVVAFTGRSLQTSPQNVDDNIAKYLNSPETDLYHKSSVLFGMDKARDAARVRGFTILVEGQMDALLAHQAGFGNTVALSGTALTDKHLALIKRASENLMFALDADAAGLAATAKSAELAIKHGLRIKAARLPDKKDPAEIITHDASAFAKIIKDAQTITDFFLSVLSEREENADKLIAEAEKIILPLVRAMPSPMEREHSMQTVARSLGLSTEAVRESLAYMQPKTIENRSLTESNNGEINPAGKNILSDSQSQIDHRARLLLAVLHAYPDTPLAKRVKSEYCRIIEVESLPAEKLPESVVFEAERIFGENPCEDAADDLIRVLEEMIIRKAHKDAVTLLRRAEIFGDTNTIKDAQARCTVLSERLATLAETQN